jgi:hypothetical protein
VKKTEVEAEGSGDVTSCEMLQREVSLDEHGFGAFDG